MINSKLVGKTLPEIIHMIVFEELTSVTYHDGEYMEMLLQEYIHESDAEDKDDYIRSLEHLLEENGIEY